MHGPQIWSEFKKKIGFTDGRIGSNIERAYRDQRTGC